MNKHCVVMTGLVGNLILGFGSAQARPIVQSNVMVAMSDGVRLAADVYRPVEGEKFPAVLIRTPYDKKGMRWFAERVVEHGYAVVVQDVRGQVKSEGKFHPFVNERQDGLDTITWVADQPWCDGSIGMWGPSYPGFCALVLAPNPPPQLKAVFQISGWLDSSKLVARGGAMHMMFILTWSLARQIHGSGSFSDYDWPDVFHRTPVSEIPKLIGRESFFYTSLVGDWLEDLRSGGKRQAAPQGRISVPVFHLSGWNDFIARDTLELHRAIAGQEGGGPVQKLMIGPWGHDQYWSDRLTKVGDLSFGKQSALGGKRLVELTVRWFDRWLKGEENGVTKEKPVRLFVMGSNEWREFDEWPPAVVSYQKWYLDSGGNANSLYGDGRLSRSVPVAAGSDSFVYDPGHPVPTLGGINFHHFDHNLGAKDQTPIEMRPDVLVYTSEPLGRDLTVVGPISVVLYAASEAANTDFTAKVVEVWTDGYARIIEDGIKRGPDGPGGSGGAKMKAGEAYRFTIDTGASAIRVAKGNRLRVEVSSSNFPKYTRNSNMGEIPELATEFRKARQTVHHSAERASHLVLPVVE